MGMPSIQVDGKFTTVFTDKMTLWFSYQTLIAFSINGDKVVCENVWTATTGKHLNMVDGGNKASRVKHKEFLRLYNDMTQDKPPKATQQGLFG